MEVPGQLAAPSKQDTSLYCLPCDRDGSKEPAYGYCRDCGEHLCESCYKHHLKPRPLRNHVLLDKASMPQQQKSENTQSIDRIDFCTNHNDKPLEFFCNKHGSLSCYVCVTLEHKHCKVDYIPDVSGNMSDEFNDIKGRMEKLIEKCKANVGIAEHNEANLHKSYEKVVEDIKLFRKELNECLDRMEAAITRDCNARLYSAERIQKNVKTESSRIAEEISSSLSLLNSLSDDKSNNKLFIEMKNVGPRLDILSDKERQTTKDRKKNGDVSFMRNNEILELLKKENSLGTISICNIPSENRAVSVQYKRTIDVKFSQHKDKCNILGMVLVSTSQMIAADFGNKKIKMIDSDNGKLISEIMLSSQPFDIMKLPQNKLAVALGTDKCIQILSYIDTSMSLDRRIDVGEKCYCVAYCQGKLVVCCNYNPGKLVILDLHGNIQQVFDTPGLYAGPDKVIISSDEKNLYVCDYSYALNGKVIKMDWQGNVVHRFEQPGYNIPRGIQELEDGTLLVSYRASNTIVRLSSSLKRCEFVGLEMENMYNPKGLAYNEKDHKLYISCSSKGCYSRCDLIKTFNIKWM